MTDTTNNLALPYLLPNQAQKHVTVNEAFQRLDAIVQITLADEDVTSPPTNAQDGLRLLVGANAGGVFTGHDGEIAAFDHGAWIFVSPLTGWLAWFQSSASLKVFDGAQWQPVSSSSGPAPSDQIARLGINTEPDPNNQISVRGAASLFNNAGTDHRLAINKAAATDTASLLFQSGFDGHAEIGLTGKNDLSVRVREPEGDWTTAIDIEADTGVANVTGLRSGIIAISPESVARIRTPSAGGFVFITIVSTTYPRIEYSGIYAYDTGLSPLLLPMALGPRASAEGATELTGTTGPEDSVNVAAGSGEILVESRYQSRRFFSYTFLC